MASIQIQDVTKSYDQTQVLHQINGDIADGEFIVIVGPSGCGKSTLLRMIAGLETITSGEIRIEDRRVNDLEPAERDIAMVFQNYALYPHMSVRENISYGLKIRKLPKQDIARRVEDVAEILEIKEYLDRKPRQLSGGQRQRVAMGRAIVRDPKVFLFDEPLSNLDAKLRVQMRLEIRKLQRRLGVTSIYVTHDQVEAMTLGDRLMVLNQGHIEQFGTPIDLYDRPASMFVAGFIGSPSMNFLPVEFADDEIVLPNHVKLTAATRGSGPVTLGIRPEHLTVDPDGPLTLEVEFVERLGANSLLHGKLSQTDINLVASIPGHVADEDAQRHTFSVHPSLQHFFDTDSGKRL